MGAGVPEHCMPVAHRMTVGAAALGGVFVGEQHEGHLGQDTAFATDRAVETNFFEEVHHV
jgi:hypothetical protein